MVNQSTSQVSALTVTGVSGAVVVEASAKAFLTGSYQSTSDLSGFTIEQKTEDNFSYPQVNLTSESGSGNDPDLQVSLFYEQEKAYEEVDLDVVWSDVESEDQFANSSPEFPNFTIAKRKFGNKQGKYGKLTLKNEPITAAMQFQLWFADPKAVTSSTTITIRITTPVEEENGLSGPIIEVEREGGSVKLLLLGQVVIKPYPG